MAEEGGGKFTYFIAGLGIGTIIGILFAPRSGEETREFLQSKAGEGREYLKRKGAEVRVQAQEYLDKGRDALAKQKENVQSAVEAGKQAYREAVQEGREAVTREKDKIQSAIDAGKKAYREARTETNES